ncbi:MAG: hypothetical protein VX008_03630 [Pseudomonadota bacterium]|nr:hypothetical protein [Pseudomonadota bacterium]
MSKEVKEFCENCGCEYNPGLTVCNVCQHPIGFPNVRKANSETEDLEQRYSDAMASLTALNKTDLVLDFQEEVKKSNVVIAKSVPDLVQLISNKNKLITTFHREVASGARLAENNQYDPNRDAVESKAHPLYYQNINYACVSLTTVGVSYYGKAHLCLDSKTIKSRTSFFQENPFLLMNKLKLTISDDLPAGYRSNWGERDKLAVCKSESGLSKCAERSEFQSLVLREDVKNGDGSDFIEANIYGPIHSLSISRVTLVGKRDKQSSLLINAYKNQFEDIELIDLQEGE